MRLCGSVLWAAAAATVLVGWAMAVNPKCLAVDQMTEEDCENETDWCFNDGGCAPASVCEGRDDPLCCKESLCNVQVCSDEETACFRRYGCDGPSACDRLSCYNERGEHTKYKACERRFGCAPNAGGCGGAGPDDCYDKDLCNPPASTKAPASTDSPVVLGTTIKVVQYCLGPDQKNEVECTEATGWCLIDGGCGPSECKYRGDGSCCEGSFCNVELCGDDETPCFRRWGCRDRTSCTRLICWDKDGELDKYAACERYLGCAGDGSGCGVAGPNDCFDTDLCNRFPATTTTVVTEAPTTTTAKTTTVKITDPTTTTKTTTASATTTLETTAPTTTTTASSPTTTKSKPIICYNVDEDGKLVNETCPKGKGKTGDSCRLAGGCGWDDLCKIESPEECCNGSNCNAEVCKDNITMCLKGQCQDTIDQQSTTDPTVNETVTETYSSTCKHQDKTTTTAAPKKTTECLMPDGKKVNCSEDCALNQNGCAKKPNEGESKVEGTCPTKNCNEKKNVSSCFKHSSPPVAEKCPVGKAACCGAKGRHHQAEPYAPDGCLSPAECEARENGKKQKVCYGDDCNLDFKADLPCPNAAAELTPLVSGSLVTITALLIHTVL